MIVKIVLICLVAILPSTLSNEATLSVIKTILTIKANDGDRINGIIKLTKNGQLGDGAFGVTYKGTLNDDDTAYAIKFTCPDHAEDAKREYEMYTYLYAINNSAVEAYGIPGIYYFAEWNEQSNVYVMAMTLMESLFNAYMRGNAPKPDIDVLVTFREFIRISKYIHSCGVRHNDIKIDNIMFRANKGFIIDYNLSTKMAVQTAAGSLLYLSRRSHVGQGHCPMDDWESFLYSMCKVVGIELDWLRNGALQNMTITEQDRFVFEKKLNVGNTKRGIQRYGNEMLRPIFIQFAKCVFSDNAVPPYDEVYRKIDSVFGKLVEAGSNGLPQWVSYRDHSQASQQLYFDISIITAPTNEMHEYPEVDFNYFANIQPSTRKGKKSKGIFKLFKKSSNK